MKELIQNTIQTRVRRCEVSVLLLASSYSMLDVVAISRRSHVDGHHDRLLAVERSHLFLIRFQT